MKKIVLAFLIVLTCLVTAVYALNYPYVNLQWNAPTTRVDGTAFGLNEVGGYNIFYGLDSSMTTSTRIPYPITTNNPSLPIMTAQVTLPQFNTTYYFAVTVYDLQGRESSISNVVSKTTDLAPPSPVQQLSIPSGFGVK